MCRWAAVDGPSSWLSWEDHRGAGRGRPRRDGVRGGFLQVTMSGMFEKCARSTTRARPLRTYRVSFNGKKLLGVWIQRRVFHLPENIRTTETREHVLQRHHGVFTFATRFTHAAVGVAVSARSLLSSPPIGVAVGPSVPEERGSGGAAGSRAAGAEMGGATSVATTGLGGLGDDKEEEEEHSVEGVGLS